MSKFKHDRESLSQFNRFLNRLRDYLKIIFDNKYYMLLICFITLCNIGCITAELHMIDEFYDDQAHRALGYAILSFSIFYFLENLIKIWTLRYQRYIKSYLNMFDGIISLTFMVINYA
jgi:hypothetical protein